jgi:hypothetical protein
MVGADERPRVAREHNDRKGAKDGVDRAALEAELTQMRSGQKGVRGVEEFLGGVMPSTRLTGVAGPPMSPGPA